MKKLMMIVVGCAAIASRIYGIETPPPYVVLAQGQFVQGIPSIHIPAGYLVEIVSLDLVTGSSDPGIPGQPWTFSRCEINQYSGIFNFELRYTSEGFPSTFPKFTGPAQIQVFSEGGQNERAVVGLKITEVANSNMVPQNTVVIPSDASGPVQVILESSKDLVSWNTANPGTYGSSTDNRFFRIRAVASQ